MCISLMFDATQITSFPIPFLNLFLNKINFNMYYFNYQMPFYHILIMVNTHNQEKFDVEMQFFQIILV